MNNILNYTKFLKIKEKNIYNINIKDIISIDLNDIFKNIVFKPIDIFFKFKINSDIILNNIETLYDNDDFNLAILNKKYNKTILEISTYNETLLKENIIFKFFFLTNKSNIIIIFQSIINNVKNNITAYTINNINKIYNILSNATVELTLNNKMYIYKTSNAGLNWTLYKSKDINNKIFKNNLDLDELNNIINTYNINFKIIS